VPSKNFGCGGRKPLLNRQRSAARAERRVLESNRQPEEGDDAISRECLEVTALFLNGRIYQSCNALHETMGLLRTSARGELGESHKISEKDSRRTTFAVLRGRRWDLTPGCIWGRR
jgi:hypothetical protein